MLLPGPSSPRVSRRSALVLGLAAAGSVLTASCTSTAPRDPDASGPSGSSGTSPPADGVDALAVGAVGDGTTDDTAALQAALDGLAPGGTLLLRRDRVFAVSDVLVVRVRGSRITGGGALLSTNEERSSLTVAGSAGADDVVLDGITLRVVTPTKRWDAYEQQRLRIDGGTGLVVRDVSIEGSAAAGVYVGGAASGFRLERVSVTSTQADGIHMTQGCSNGTVSDPLITGSGDDGVAVVSYQADGEPCHDILVERPVVRGTVVGRGISVVGGRGITYRHVDVDSSGAAGVYIASEGSYDTAGVSGVLVSGGRITRANTDASTDHGAVLVFDGSGRAVTDVVIEDLQVVDTRSTASRQVGVLVDGEGAVTGVRLDDLSLSGGPGRALEVTGGATVTTSSWTDDGTPLADPASATAPTG